MTIAAFAVSILITLSATDVIDINDDNNNDEDDNN
jgi:hypothetical protein